MKIIVTGAGGQLGTDTVAVLLECGHETIALTSSGLDITDSAAVKATIAAQAPELIVNCAAYTGVDKAESEPERAVAINADGIKNLAQAAKETGAVIIHISTDFVFNGKTPNPYTESDATAPLGVYGSSKLKGEEALQEVLKECIIIRTSWLYGAHGANFVSTMIRLAKERESLGVVYDQTGSPTWTKELARVIAVIAEKIEEGTETFKEGIWGVYHYANHGIASWYDLAVTAIEEARNFPVGKEIVVTAIKPIRSVEYPTPAERPAYSVLDCAKIKKIFGIEIPYWKVSLKEMLKELE